MPFSLRFAFTTHPLNTRLAVYEDIGRYFGPELIPSQITVDVFSGNCRPNPVFQPFLPKGINR